MTTTFLVLSFLFPRLTLLGYWRQRVRGRKRRVVRRTRMQAARRIDSRWERQITYWEMP